MERKASDAAFAFCSPIPRDPTQRLFVDDRADAPQTPGNADSFFDPEVEAMTGIRGSVEESGTASVPRAASNLPPTHPSPGHALAALGSANLRVAKRPRLEAESAAIVKSELLTTEVESLRLQLEHRTESHQIQLKERDLQLNQLRRQLQYAVAEEEHARQELKSLSTEYANEKLQLQKKVVELESKLQFVETSFSEWREKADDTANELRTVARQSKLKIQLLNDEIDLLKTQAAPPAPVEYSVLESKVKLLEVSLRDKELEVQHADERIQNASMTLESSKDVRTLTERIAELESHERHLKQELVELIESSRRSAVHDEKLIQMRQKLQVSDQRYSNAQQEIATLNGYKVALEELHEFFQPLMKEQGVSISLQDKGFTKAVIGAFKNTRTTMVELEGEKKQAEKETQSLRAALEDGRQAESMLRRQVDASAVTVKDLQEQVAATASALAPMQKANQELVELLQSYKTSDVAGTDGNSAQLSRLSTLLLDTAPLVKQLGALAVKMGSPTFHLGETYEREISDLKASLKASEKEVERVVAQLQRSERECAVLEKRLGRGEFNPDTTKASTTPATNLTTTTSYETVEGQKLLNQRLKEVFQNQIQQYREAVYQLTGFKVDLKKSNGVELLRLRSMYADHDDDELLVRMESNGTLELLETEFCAQINKRVFAYLTTCRSFPAFLSTLTLHLFEKQTFQGN